MITKSTVRCALATAIAGTAWLLTLAPATAAMHALNPQPLPPGMRALNPQPLPPGLYSPYTQRHGGTVHTDKHKDW